MDIDHLRSSTGSGLCPHKSHGNKKNIERVNSYEEHNIVTDEIDPLPFLVVYSLFCCLNLLNRSLTIFSGVSVVPLSQSVK